MRDKEKRKRNPFKYTGMTRGLTAEVIIRDETYRKLYKNKFNMSDKNSMITHLRVLEQYSKFSLYQLIKDLLKINDWW